MSVLDDIVNEWEQDSNIDITNIRDESIKTPVLHSKYLSLLASYKQKLITLNYKLKEIKRWKTRWLNGEMSLDECKERGIEQYQFVKPIRSMIPEILDADPDVYQIRSQVEMVEAIIEVLQSILGIIKGRDYSIGNFIKYEALKLGIK